MTDAPYGARLGTASSVDTRTVFAAQVGGFPEALTRTRYFRLSSNGRIGQILKPHKLVKTSNKAKHGKTTNLDGMNASCPCIEASTTRFLADMRISLIWRFTIRRPGCQNSMLNSGFHSARNKHPSTHSARRNANTEAECSRSVGIRKVCGLRTSAALRFWETINPGRIGLCAQFSPNKSTSHSSCLGRVKVQRNRLSAVSSSLQNPWRLILEIEVQQVYFQADSDASLSTCLPRRFEKNPLF